MFDGSTIQDIVTRHLDLLHDKFVRFSKLNERIKQSISRGCEIPFEAVNIPLPLKTTQVLMQNIDICHECFKAAVLNLYRLADHLTNFVSVRGPPKISIFSWENF